MNQQTQQALTHDSNRRKIIRKNDKPVTKVHKMISSSYKTKKCEFYNRGACQKGESCTFSHEFTPDNAIKICKFYLSNSCTKGLQCGFSHNTSVYPCTFYHLMNNCNQEDNCRFSHGQIRADQLDQFLKDNEQALLKAYNLNKLTNEKYKQYVESNRLQEKFSNQKDKQENNQNMPYIFGQPQILNKNDTDNKKQLSKQPPKDPRLKILEGIQNHDQLIAQNRPKQNTENNLLNKKVLSNNFRADKLEIFKQQQFTVQNIQKFMCSYF